VTCEGLVEVKYCTCYSNKKVTKEENDNENEKDLGIFVQIILLPQGYCERKTLNLEKTTSSACSICIVINLWLRV